MFNTIKMISKLRIVEIYIKEEDSLKALKCIKSFTGVDAIRFNHCNWTNAPEIYRIKFVCMTIDMAKLYRTFDSYGIKIYPKTVKWTGYQE